MKPDASDKDLAFTAMAMDILSNVLSRADNPADLGIYLTEEVRELTGARCVLLIQCLSTPTELAHHVVSVNPLRRREWAESPDGNHLYEVVHRVPAAQLWRGEEPSEAAGLLRREGFELSTVFPLHVGEFRVGAMLVLGLPDEEHITSVLSLLNNLSSIVALVLRNAILYEKQEQLIQERTAELRGNNEKLAMELTERKKAEEELQFRNVLLTTQQEVSLDGILVVDENARILSYNRRFVEMMGLPPKLVEDRVDEPVLQFVTAQMADPRSFLQRVQYLYEHRQETSRDELILADGRFFDRYSAPMIGSDNRYFGRVWYFRDITERKRAEMEIARVNRTLQMLSDTNQALIHITDEAALLNEVCRIAVEAGGYRMAWIGFAEQDEAKTIRPVAHAGFESGYIESAKVTWADNERGRGPSGTAIRTGQPCIARNIPLDPAFAPWHEAAIQRGYKSNIALPLISEGRTFGELAIHSIETDAFDAKEVEILEELANNLAFGVTTLRTRAKRDQAKEALKKSESRLNEAQRMAHIGSWELDIVNNVLIWSDEIYRMFEIDPKKFGATYEAFLNAIHPDDREAVNFAYTNSLKTRIAYNIDHRLLFSDGRVKYVHEQCETLYDPDGNPLRSVGSVQDISERQRAEEALRESENRYRRLAENARDVIYRMSLPDGKYEYISPAALAVFGYSQEEFYKTPALVKKLIHPDWQKYFEEQWANLIKGEMPPTYEYQFIHKSGEVRWLNQRNILVRDNAGNPIAIEGIVTDITERKRAERKATQLAAIVESSEDAIIGKSLDGIIMSWNKGAEKIYGYSESEVIGKPISIVIPPERADEVLQIIKKIKLGEYIEHYEAMRRKKDGQDIHMSLSISPIRDTEGRVVAASTIGRDISERKRTEEALEKRLVALTRPFDESAGIEFEELFNLNDIQRLQDEFAKATGVASIITHPDGTPITEPSNFCRLCKDIIRKTDKGRANCYKSDSVLGHFSAQGPSIQPCMSGGLWDAGAGISVGGHHIANWLIGQVRDETQSEDKMRKYAREIGADESDFIEAFHEVTAMSQEQFQRVAQALFTLAKQLSAIAYQNIQQARFITERKRVEEALRAASLYNRRLIEANIDPLVTIGPDGKITDINEATEIVTGVPRERLIGDDFANYFTEPAKAKAGYQKVLAEGWVRDYPLTIQHASGKTTDVLYNATVYKNETGKIQGVFAAARDITEIKLAENKVRLLNEELEQRVLQRTAQLQAANKELEAFSYSVSHDLRAPLRAIDGFSRIVLEEYAPKLDDEGRRLLDVIRGNTKKMGQLIDDLLAFSRLSRQQLAFAPVDLAVLADAVFSELKNLEKRRRIEFKVGALPAAFGDRSMLRLVLQNLLSNAIKFSRPRTKARIEFGGRTAIGETIYYVKDNGVGFNMEYVGKLFGVFQRLHGSDEFEGTGVGLAIVQRIVLRHSGRVWAESAAKGGATFYFSLPTEDRPGIAEPATAS